MKLKTFFEKFDQFADAPDAVAKMRELVLQLAVRGQLVPQNPKEEPASKAIERLAALNGSGRTAKLPVEAKSVELPFAVPGSWKWVRFGDLVRIRTGKLDANAAVEGGEYPFFTCSKTPSQIATYSFDTSAVILAGNGDFNLKSYSGKFDAYQRTYVIEPVGWELGFCFWLISAQIKRITDNQRGSAIPYLRLGDIADPLVPFPPLAEQKRIVAKVDELMALCDQLEAQQQERDEQASALARASLARFAEVPIPTNLNLLFHKSYSIAPADLRKAILAMAVQGKLLPQNLKDEPIIQCLGRISQMPKPARYDNRSNAKIQGIAALSVGPTKRGVPKGWLCVPLIQICRLESGHTPSRSRPDWWGGDVSWVGLVDARLHNGKKIFETIQHTNEEGLANSAARMLPAGTVCVSRTASVGYVIILGKPMATSQDFVNWVPSEAVTSEWLQLVFISEKDAFSRFSKGAVHQTIYYPEWISMHTLLPPVAEQRRIVAKVDQLLALVDQLETQLSASCATAKNLLEALVAELTHSS